MAQDRLSNAEQSNHQGESQEVGIKLLEIAFLIDQGVADKNQGNVIEVQLHAQDAIKDAGRFRIKDLDDAKPEEKEERKAERQFEGLHFPFAVGEIER